MNYRERNFGYCLINWKIKNACVTVCKSHWKIFSPDFHIRGAVPTKWRMALVPESDLDPLVELTEIANPVVMFYLECLNCNEISCIAKVEVLLNIEMGDTIVNASPIYKSFVNVKSGFWVKLVNLNCMIKKGHSGFHSDDINLKCHLLVCFKDYSETIEPCSDAHVEQLSEHLFELYDKHYESDIVIKMDSQEIKAHKCVLHTRSKYFAKKINKNPHKTDIVIKSKSDFESLRKIIAFIYTGNLEFVLNEPSILIFMLADQFRLKDILDYYLPDKLDMCSEISCDEFCFAWAIRSLLCQRNPSLENFFTTKVDDISCILRLHPRDARNSKFITCFVEIIGETAARDICIEFAVKYGKKHFCLAKTQKSFSEVKKIECMKIIRRSQLAKISKNGDLILEVKFRISNGEYDTILGKSEDYCIESCDNSYDNLCMDMKLMYTESIFKDVVIYSKTGRVQANKCILAMRSRHLYDEFDGKNFVKLSIDDDLLEELLHYLYSSTYRHAEQSRHTSDGIKKFINNYLKDCLKGMCSHIIN